MTIRRIGSSNDWCRSFNNQFFINDRATTIAIVESNDAQSVDFFYLGLSELYNKDYTNAVIHLSEVLVRPDQQYKEDATWYLSPVSYTHLRAHRDGLLSRMPSSA